MIRPEDVNAPHARKCLSELLDAIPKWRRGLLHDKIAVVEAALKRSFALLESIRRFLLAPASGMGGEDAPFVREIEELLLRRRPRKGVKPKGSSSRPGPRGRSLRAVLSPSPTRPR